MSRIKISSFYLLSFFIAFVIFEISTSTFLIYWYRFQGIIPPGVEKGSLSSVVFLNKLSHTVDLDHLTAEPSPFLREHPSLGYYTAPGKYIFTFRRPLGSSEYQYFKTKVTINDDGARWTGESRKGSNRTIYVFGDSSVFGWGVNDEQTFSYLLQQSLNGTNVKLFANGGYSLTQAFINFEQMKDKISSDDILILGYADYYKKRHVAAPSRLKEFGDPRQHLYDSNPTHPKVSLDSNGNIQINQVPLFCKFNKNLRFRLPETPPPA